MTTTHKTPEPSNQQDPTLRPDEAGAQSGAPAKIPRTRMGETWVAFVAAAFVLLLLLIFILQNGQRSEVSFLGAHGTLPMGVALLLSAVFGVLVVALPGTARIIQLRRRDHRHGGTVSR